MSNNCSVKILFTGEKENLEKVKDLIIKPSIYSNESICFDYIKDKVPGISNKQIYQLFGCDLNKLLHDKYSNADVLKFNNKVNKLLEQESWIGLRDYYINDSAREVNFSITNETLLINCEFSSYCPTNFFAVVAKDFDLKLKTVEFIEGDKTIISYIDHNNQCIDITNNSSNILTNKIFRDYSLEL